MKEGSNRLWINSFRLLNSVWYKKTKCVEDWEGYRDCIWGGWLGLVDFPSFSIKKRLLLSVHHVPKVHVVGIHSMLTSARHLFPVLAFWPRFFLLHSTDVFLHPLCLPQLLLRDHLTTDSVVWHTASYADPTVESEQTGSSLSAAEKCNTSYCTVSPPRSSSHSTEIWRVSKMSSFEKRTMSAPCAGFCQWEHCGRRQPAHQD